MWLAKLSFLSLLFWKPLGMICPDVQSNTSPVLRHSEELSAEAYPGSPSDHPQAHRGHAQDAFCWAKADTRHWATWGRNWKGAKYLRWVYFSFGRAQEDKQHHWALCCTLTIIMWKMKHSHLNWCISCICLTGPKQLLSAKVSTTNSRKKAPLCFLSGSPDWMREYSRENIGAFHLGYGICYWNC